MTNVERSQPRVSTSAEVNINLRTSRLLMFLRLRVERATRELGLIELRAKFEECARRLTSLGAIEVGGGDPEDDQQAEFNPMAMARSRYRPRPGRSPNTSLPERPAVNMLLTAVWDVESASSEQFLLLRDRVQYEMSIEPSERPASNRTAPDFDPADHLRSALAQIENPPPDLSPHFLYLGKPTEEQILAAVTEARGKALAEAERLAQVAGGRLGALSYITSSTTKIGMSSFRDINDSLFKGLLAKSTYELRDGEVGASTRRTLGTSVTVHLTYELITDSPRDD